MIRLQRSLSQAGVVLAVLGLGFASACAGAPSNSTPPAAHATSAATGPISPTAAPGKPVTGHLGDTLKYFDTGGDEVDVTTVKVTDPATASSTSGALPSGERWVGVELTIDDHLADPAEDSHAVEGTSPDGQRHGASVDGGYRVYGFDGCTPTAQSAANQPTTYCTGFAVPVGVSVVQYGYSVTGVDIGAPDDVEWTVP